MPPPAQHVARRQDTAVLQANQLRSPSRGDDTRAGATCRRSFRIYIWQCQCERHRARVGQHSSDLADHTLQNRLGSSDLTGHMPESCKGQEFAVRRWCTDPHAHRATPCAGRLKRFTCHAICQRTCNAPPSLGKAATQEVAQPGRQRIKHVRGAGYAVRRGGAHSTICASGVGR